MKSEELRRGTNAKANKKTQKRGKMVAVSIFYNLPLANFTNIGTVVQNQQLEVIKYEAQI